MFEFLGVESATEPSRGWVSRKVPRLLCPQTYGPSGYKDEVLVLRHFDELSTGEAAAVLGLDKSAASERYARALIRLKEILASLRGGLSEV
jgi:hypothetical protein